MNTDPNANPQSTPTPPPVPNPALAQTPAKQGVTMPTATENTTLTPPDKPFQHPPSKSPLFTLWIALIMFIIGLIGGILLILYYPSYMPKPQLAPTPTPTNTKKISPKQKIVIPALSPSIIPTASATATPAIIQSITPALEDQINLPQEDISITPQQDLDGLSN